MIVLFGTSYKIAPAVGKKGFSSNVSKLSGQYAFWNNLQQDFIKLINKIGKKEGMNFWRSLVGYWDTLV